MRRGASELDALWAAHHAEWREPRQILSLWPDASATDPRLLVCRTRGDWWGTLAAHRITLLVTREYEHLVIGMQAAAGRPRITYLPMPHPSGLVADRARGVVHIASTRNPNQLFELAPVSGLKARLDAAPPAPFGSPLVPSRSRFLPGCLYLHDLALIRGRLFGNAVGENAIVRLPHDAAPERVWWPRCIDRPAGPIFGRNHLQLNSIAAGSTLQGSFFSASTDRVSPRRPGHRNFPVDRRGVIFSGKSREPMARGLTRPHSARLFQGKVWVDNSGYGEFGFIRSGALECVARLPGWTRGLCFVGDTAFVGTSRVIPRFRQYAPGLDVDASQCAVHAVDTRSGRVLGSLTWPSGNQIFAIDWMPAAQTSGLPFVQGKPNPRREKLLFYAFKTAMNEGL